MKSGPSNTLLFAVFIKHGPIGQNQICLKRTLTVRKM